MSDPRPDDTNLSERSSLPPDLLPIHDRLSGDGARWRWRAPDGAGLAAWARATLDYAGERTRESAGHQPLREWWLEHVERQSAYPPGPKGPMRDMTMTRIRGFAGAAAAIVVVGLIALLLTHNAATRGGTGGTGVSATSTPQPGIPGPTGTPGQSSQQQPLQPGQLPIVAQSDPAIVYQLKDNALMRSSNGGAAYTAEQLPKTDVSSIDFSSVAVSPLDANHVFISFSGKVNGQGCLPPANAYPALAMHGGIDASGYVPCTEQYVSVDGGHTWSKLRLPTKGALGGLNDFREMPGDSNGNAYTFQAQGQRLYSAMAFASDGGVLIDSQGARLVASDDGGVTWKFVDTTLAASNRYVCDFAAAPTSSTLYAVTADQACGNETYPNLSLWKSANGGQSWARVRQLPTKAESGLVVGANGELYSFMPQVTVQSHSASATNSPANALVSLDGGVTFTGAPSAGLPGDPLLSGPFATLADGSVVYEVFSSGRTSAIPPWLYAWKPGDSAWRKISPAIPSSVAAVTVTSPAAGATQQTISIIDDAGHITTVKLPIGQ